MSGAIQGSNDCQQPLRLPPKAREHGKKARWLVVAAMAATITLVHQCHTVFVPIYKNEHAKRMLIHEAIVQQEVPRGYKSWDALGANGLKSRRVAVMTVQLAHETTGVSLQWLHFAQDTALMWLGLVLLFFYVRRWVPPSYALIAMLYVGVLGPLVAKHWYFHPWDRMSQVVWLAGFWAVAARSHVGVAAATVVGIPIANSSMLLAGLHFLATLREPGAYRGGQAGKWRTWAVAVGICIAAMAVEYTTRAPTPSGNLPFLEVLKAAVGVNIADMKAAMIVGWSPMLFWGLPLLLSLPLAPRLPKLLQAQLLWAALGVGAALTAHGGLKEVRNQVGFLFAAMPAFLVALQAWMGDDHAPSGPNV